MSDLGALVSSRRGNLGVALGVAAVAVPALGLFLFLCFGVFTEGFHKGDEFALALTALFGIGGCVWAVETWWAFVKVFEKGVHQRSLLGSLRVAWSEVASIAVTRLRRGEQVSTGVEVALVDGTRTQLNPRNLLSDAELETVVQQVVGVVGQRFSTALDAGQPVPWCAGLVLEPNRLAGTLDKATLQQTSEQLGMPDRPVSLAFDDELVSVSVQSGWARIQRQAQVVAVIPCSAANYQPGLQQLVQRTAWSIAA
jgi:hypothetical protein